MMQTLVLLPWKLVGSLAPQSSRKTSGRLHNWDSTKALWFRAPFKGLKPTGSRDTGIESEEFETLAGGDLLLWKSEYLT
jgi:hypothetical protein